MTREFEKRKLLEAEGLQRFITLHNVYLDEMEELLEEYSDFLDDELVGILHMLQYMAAVTLEAEVPVEGSKPVIGLVRQYEDVMQEIEVTQAGKPTKHGIPDEETDDE
jgi:hypothetical protein